MRSNSVNGAKALGLTPTGTQLAEAFCQGCWNFLKDAGVAALSALKRGVIP